MYLHAGPLRKVRSVNSTTTSFTAPVCEINLSLTDAGTAAGRSIIPLLQGVSGQVRKKIEVWPYGLGANNDAFTLRLIGWNRIAKDPSLTEQREIWVPGILGDFACIMGNFTGLAGFPVLNTEFFCDTITQTNAQEPTKLGNSTLLDGFTKRYTPANDTPARMHVHLEACEAIEFQFDNTTNTPSMNALYRFIDHD